jgi:hypothetical protein
MTSQGYRIVAALLAASTVLAHPIGPAAACAYHGAGGINLFAAHPGSTDVATALQAAAQAGTIEIPAAALPPVSMVAYHRMVKQIERFRDLLESAGKRRTPSFSLLLIDSALWSRFTPEPAGIELAVHTAGPDRGEPVVLTSGAVIRSVLDGRLSAGDALNRGLIRVEAAVDEKLALFGLLSAAAKRP